MKEVRVGIDAYLQKQQVKSVTSVDSLEVTLLPNEEETKSFFYVQGPKTDPNKKKFILNTAMVTSTTSGTNSINTSFTNTMDIRLDIVKFLDFFKNLKESNMSVSYQYFPFTLQFPEISKFYALLESPFYTGMLQQVLLSSSYRFQQIYSQWFHYFSAVSSNKYENEIMVEPVFITVSTGNMADMIECCLPPMKFQFFVTSNSIELWNNDILMVKFKKGNIQQELRELYEIYLRIKELINQEIVYESSRHHILRLEYQLLNQLAHLGRLRQLFRKIQQQPELSKINIGDFNEVLSPYLNDQRVHSLTKDSTLVEQFLLSGIACVSVGKQKREFKIMWQFEDCLFLGKERKMSKPILKKPKCMKKTEIRQLQLEGSLLQFQYYFESKKATRNLQLEFQSAQVAQLLYQYLQI